MTGHFYEICWYGCITAYLLSRVRWFWSSILKFKTHLLSKYYFTWFKPTKRNKWMQEDYEIGLNFYALIRWGNMTFNLDYSWVGFYIRSISYTIFLGALLTSEKLSMGGHWLQLPRTVDACLPSDKATKKTQTCAKPKSNSFSICHTLHSMYPRKQ